MSAAHKDRWTPDQENHLRTLVSEGHTVRVIASHLGKERNAVIGKARRMGLSIQHAQRMQLKTNPVRAAATSSQPRPKAGKGFETLPGTHSVRRAADAGTGCPAQEPQPVPVAFRPRDPLPWIEAKGCQWHLGPRNLDPGEHMMMLVCNEPSLTGKRFCEHHFRTYFHKSEKRLRAA